LYFVEWYTLNQINKGGNTMSIGKKLQGKPYVLIVLGLLLTVGTFGCGKNEAGGQSASGSPSASVELTAEEKAKIEAEAKAKVEAEAKAAAELKAKQEAEEKARLEAEAKAKEEEEALKKANLEKVMYAEHARSTVAWMTNNELALDQKTYDFMVNNHNLFPTKTDSDIQAAKDMADKSISSKLLNKNPIPYLDKMATFSGYVVEISETLLDDGSPIATVHVWDDNDQSYQVLLYSTTGDILEEDYVRFWGVPVGPWGFENVSGGYTNVQFLIGSHIEKL